jgi:hypothetical protein
MGATGIEEEEEEEEDHYAARRKVAGSISDEVIGFFKFI